MTNDADTQNKRIINALQRDGRADVLDIAKRTNIPATTVQKRLKRLTESEIITGYEPRIDYDRLGYELTVVFKLDMNDPTGGIIHDLRNDSYIISLYEVTGEFDVLAIGTFPDTATMNERVRSILSSPEIRAGRTNIVSNTVLENEPIELQKADTTRGSD
ncbi:Lrp/AsnC family transcriptional regulator [Halocatena salina]|uniref:Lrp/AsnC family transcriptional regulator n=1 Tax=Halocatena salina TaxID=2934340 RepID=A0A8U0A4D0_9EURY|nr:Lrp/AsnC family transcriptional regulator [Halocatena salina]UPM44075.1 Lrp/AsnC family transcriptional regulator [Halocatena salina]